MAPRWQSIRNRQGKACSFACCSLEKGMGAPDPAVLTAHRMGHQTQQSRLPTGWGTRPSSPDCPQEGVPHPAVLTAQPPDGRTALWTALRGPLPVEVPEVLRITWERDGRIPSSSYLYSRPGPLWLLSSCGFWFLCPFFTMLVGRTSQEEASTALPPQIYGLAMPDP